MDEQDLDPDFAERFHRERRPPCQLYLISPEILSAGFEDRLRAALDAAEAWLATQPGLDRIVCKFSFDDEMPFNRTKVKLKKEIVTNTSWIKAITAQIP